MSRTCFRDDRLACQSSSFCDMDGAGGQYTLSFIDLERGGWRSGECRGAIVGDDRIVTGPSEPLVAAPNKRVARTKPFDAEGTQLIDTAGWGDVIW